MKKYKRKYQKTAINQPLVAHPPGGEGRHPPGRRPPPPTAHRGYPPSAEGVASVHGGQRPISLEYQICPPATTIWYSSNWNDTTCFHHLELLLCRMHLHLGGGDLFYCIRQKVERWHHHFVGFLASPPHPCWTIFPKPLPLSTKCLVFQKNSIVFAQTNIYIKYIYHMSLLGNKCGLIFKI